MAGAGLLHAGGGHRREDVCGLVLHEHGPLRVDPGRAGVGGDERAADGGAGGGVYAYGSSSTFPTNTYEASNYWVDVVYSPAAGTGIRRRCRAPRRPGSSSNPVSTEPTATFSEAVVPGTVSFTVTARTGTRWRAP